MKVWIGFGSEHSANLVLIGRFQTAPAAERAKAAIDKLTHFVADIPHEELPVQRYSDELSAVLHEVGLHSVALAELEQFNYQVSSEVAGTEVRLTTDEPDVSAFIKLMVDHGARVEIFSAHYNKEDPEGSG